MGPNMQLYRNPIQVRLCCFGIEGFLLELLQGIASKGVKFVAPLILPIIGGCAEAQTGRTPSRVLGIENDIPCHVLRPTDFF